MTASCPQGMFLTREVQMGVEEVEELPRSEEESLNTSYSLNFILRDVEEWESVGAWSRWARNTPHTHLIVASLSGAAMVLLT